MDDKLIELADELEMRILDFRILPKRTPMPAVLNAHIRIVEKQIEFTQEAVRIMLQGGRQ